MRQINITKQMLEEYPSEQYETILEDTYCNYDSRLITENLQLDEIKRYLEKRTDLREYNQRR